MTFMWMLGQENKARAPTWGGGEGVGKPCWAPWPKVLHINSSWFHYYPSLIRSFLIPGRFVCVCVYSEQQSLLEAQARGCLISDLQQQPRAPLPPRWIRVMDFPRSPTGHLPGLSHKWP